MSLAIYSFPSTLFTQCKTHIHMILFKFYISKYMKSMNSMGLGAWGQFIINIYKSLEATSGSFCLSTLQTFTYTFQYSTFKQPFYRYNGVFLDIYGLGIISYTMYFAWLVNHSLITWPTNPSDSTKLNCTRWKHNLDFFYNIILLSEF